MVLTAGFAGPRPVRNAMMFSPRRAGFCRLTNDPSGRTITARSRPSDICVSKMPGLAEDEAVFDGMAHGLREQRMNAWRPAVRDGMADDGVAVGQRFILSGCDQPARCGGFADRLGDA